MDIQPVVTVGDDKIYPLIFTPENADKFWQHAKQFPSLYGQEINGSFEAFVNIFMVQDVHGDWQTRGLFWVMNDFTGVFLVDNITYLGGEPVDGNVHYTFFDRRHRGRVPIVKEMFKHIFAKYNFQRLSAAIPNCHSPQARHFAVACGMAYEGKKRKSAMYKGDWFDTNLYGILKTEVLNGKPVQGNNE